MVKRALVVIFIIFNLYAILCGGLYFFQENLIFHPEQLPLDYTYVFENSHEEVWIDAGGGGRLQGLHFEVKDPRGVILYFHGNAGSLAGWGEIVQYFVNKEFSVVVMDYRQYGKSTGGLSEQKLYDDALLWYTYTKKIYPTQPLISYGRSLGTTFAAYVASQHPVDHLILETPFYSLEDEAQSRFPILPAHKLLSYKFPTYQFAKTLKTDKVTILHGTNDRVVAFEHGKRLYEEIRAGNKSLITIPDGGHNNLIDFVEYQEGVDYRLLNPLYAQ